MSVLSPLLTLIYNENIDKHILKGPGTGRDGSKSHRGVCYLIREFRSCNVGGDTLLWKDVLRWDEYRYNTKLLWIIENNFWVT